MWTRFSLEAARTKNEIMKNGCLGAALGTFLGGCAGFIRAVTFVPTGPIAGDGMDKAFGQMGCIVAGLVFGCLTGIIISAFVSDKQGK